MQCGGFVVRFPRLLFRGEAPQKALKQKAESAPYCRSIATRALRRVRTSSPSTSAAASQAPSEGCTPSNGSGAPGASDAARALRRDTRPMAPRTGAAHATQQLHAG